MLRDNWFPAHKVSVPPRAIRLGVPAVLCSESLQQRLDRLGEAGVGGGLRRPSRITPRRGHGKQSEDSDARGLPLKGYVGVEPC